MAAYDKLKKWRAANPEKVSAQRAAARAKNQEKEKARCREWQANNKEWIRLYRQANKDRSRDQELRRKYGISLEKYNEILLSQSCRCRICSIHQTSLKKKFAVDHCHDTGRIRGLLCFDCNTGIGKLKDDPNLLVKAAEYLKGA